MNRYLAGALGCVVVAAAVGLPVWWLTGSEPPKPTTPSKPSGFAADTLPPAEQPMATPLKFDGERALKYVKQLCDLGPRVSGTEAMKKQQEILEKHFTDLGAKVARQTFEAKQRSRPDKVSMTNLIVTWHPEKTRRIIICSHYDTRPIADQEAVRGNWTKPFASANDGTSGAAWMMELAHSMKDLKSDFGVDFILFDGEEYVFQTDARGEGDRYFIGSEYFAEQYAKEPTPRKVRYEAGVLLDLFAAKGARLAVEGHSWQMAQAVVQQIWGIADKVGAKSFVFERGFKRSLEVSDDHLALNRVGIPSVDVIDFDYPEWHKLTDTPDKISGEQMAEVSKVLTIWLQRIK